MKFNRKTVREQFAAYTRNYDPGDPKIALKISHTYRVAENCEAIARSLNLADEEVEFAWLSGMLHDVGRFEQVKRYNTFIDSESVDHAEFGADLLFGPDALIRTYTDADTAASANAGPNATATAQLDDATMETVIRQHNKYRIDETLDERTKVFCQILRDADKVDILKVSVDTPMEDIFNETPEALRTYGVSDIVMEQVREHHAVPRDLMKTPADHLICHIALAFELVYPKSWELTKEQGYIYKMFDFPTDNETTKRAIEEARQELFSFMDA